MNQCQCAACRRKRMIEEKSYEKALSDFKRAKRSKSFKIAFTKILNEIIVKRSEERAKRN